MTWRTIARRHARRWWLRIRYGVKVRWTPGTGPVLVSRRRLSRADVAAIRAWWRDE